jgi:ribonuclease T2
MTTKWPNLNGKDNSFWSYEYCKHGTCAANILPTSDGYFSKTMALYDVVNQKLGRARINQVDAKCTFAQLKAALGMNGRYTCVQSAGKQYLKELGYCYNKAFAAINCPAPGNCDRKKPFFL